MRGCSEEVDGRDGAQGPPCLGSRCKSLSPKPSGMVLSRAEPGQREPGFRQRLMRGDAQGRLRSLELDPHLHAVSPQGCQRAPDTAFPAAGRNALSPAFPRGAGSCLAVRCQTSPAFRRVDVLRFFSAGEGEVRAAAEIVTRIAATVRGKLSPPLRVRVRDSSLLGWQLRSREGSCGLA